MLSSNVKEEKDFNPWPGLTLACVRILELYAKVFEQDLQLIARKNCKNCRCVRDCHEIVAEHGARSRLGLNAIHDGLNARSLGYTFVPPGLTTARQVDQYFSSLPPQEVPKLGSRGENTRLQRIVKQLPKQDLALSACKYVEDSARNSFQDFISARNEIALDIGLAKPAPPNSICENCKRTIPNQQIGVVAPRMGELIWHPACFQCSTCKNLLVDLAYCVHEEKIYCERHYAELLKPRCEGCDELLTASTHLKSREAYCTRHYVPYHFLKI